jgi:APA family basic amino acid/polyamine antiporter
MPAKADPSGALRPQDDARRERPHDDSNAGLARRLTAFDATMIVMGGIIGGGIFVNPAEVARRVTSPGLSTLAWSIGGLIALVGAFVYAELAARRPQVGGQYAYLRDAYHPVVAFLYGWTLLLVVQTGGMAAAAMIFGRYTRELTGIGTPEGIIAVGTLMTLTVINCIGVRAGSNVQSFFMVVKLMVIAAVVITGLMLFGDAAPAPAAAASPAPGGGSAIGVMTALVPILFTYGGWQTASFVSGEMRNPTRDLPRGLIAGVIGVVIVYLLVNTSFLSALGFSGLAASKAPASDVMRAVFGGNGGRFIAAGVAISTVGFLSQSMLTAPRVYYAMAKDGVFFRRIGELGERSRVPVAAILLQGICASIIALVGRFDQVLNYVVSIDVLFFGLTGAALLVYRRRAPDVSPPIRVPLHPFSTILFVAACWAIAITTVVSAPRDAGGGVVILAIGVPVYLWWARRRAAGTLSS